MALRCELSIIRAKNIDMIKSNESLFVRCYLSTGKSTKIKLTTHEIFSNSNLTWNQTFSFECLGNKKKNILSESSVVVELRRRITVPIFGKIRKSLLLSRAEVPWKSFVETKEMEIEKWLFMSVTGTWVSEDVKPPAVQVAMKLVELYGAEETASERRRRLRKQACSSECRCSSCGHCDMFALD